jgi:hypothetical protein
MGMGRSPHARSPFLTGCLLLSQSLQTGIRFLQQERFNASGFLRVGGKDVHRREISSDPLHISGEQFKAFYCRVGPDKEIRKGKQLVSLQSSAFSLNT